MNINSIEIDRVTDPKSLELRLFSSNFHEFVAMLGASRSNGNQSLESVVATKIEQVLSEGLQCLSTREIQTLLDNPSCLLALQERIFIDGGQYWEDIIERSGSRKFNLDALVDQAADCELSLSHGAASVEPVKKSVERSSFFHSQVWASLATGLLVFAGLFTYQAVKVSLTPDKHIAFLESGKDKSGTQLLSHYAQVMEGLKAEDRSEREFSTRLAGCVEICLLMLRSDHNLVSQDCDDQLVQKCKGWLGDFAALAVMDTDYRQRSFSLNEKLEAISDAIRDLSALELAAHV